VYLHPSEKPPESTIYTILCDKIDYLSEDSDADKEQKYNILYDSDVIEEEEEDEGNNEDDEEDEDIDEYMYNLKLLKMTP
jgi:hypothetical protein